MSNALLEAALKYAGMGWKVFPCVPRNKTPLTRHGFKDASEDFAQIREWWTKWPSANVAVATGEASGVSVVDIDVDVTKNKNGWDTIAKLKEAGNSFQRTAMQNTPRGGAHLFFTSGSHPGCATDLHPAIDIRGNGGYVLLPPSIHPNGKPYTWEPEHSPFDIALASYPSFLRQEKPAAPAKSPEPTRTTYQRSDVHERAAAYLRECEPATQGQGGHNKLLWAATAMVHGFLLPTDESYTLLAEEFNPRCDPPWNLSDPRDEKDFRRKIDESARLTPSKPRGWLLQDDLPANTFTREEIDRLIASSTEVATAVSRGSSVERDREMDFLTKPTGLLGDMCGWINQNAVRPQPLLALACSIATLGVVLGRRVWTPPYTRTNVYTIGVAPSSSGKNWPMKACQRMLEESGYGHMIGGLGATSDSSLEKLLLENPSAILYWDEVGLLLKGMKAGGSQHTAGIVPLMMSLYSSADGVFRGKDRATDARNEIIQPCLCFFGTATPGSFYNGISVDDIEDGWLARCLIFSSDDIQRKRDVEPSEVPRVIIEEFRRWRERFALQVPEGGDIAQMTGRMSEGAGSKPYPLIVKKSVGATNAFNSLDEEFYTRSKAKDPQASLWGKAAENAQKIALIVAGGNYFDSPEIDDATADYAVRLIRFILTDYEKRIAPQIFVNSVDRDKGKLLELIRSGGVNGRDGNFLSRKTQHIRPPQRNEHLEDMFSAELIHMEHGPRKSYHCWSIEAWEQLQSNAEK